MMKPEDAQVYLELGMEYAVRGEYDNAIVLCDVAITLDPGNAMAYMERGEVYLDKNEHELAIVDFDTVILLSPANASAYCSRGLGYFGLQDYDRAISDFDAAIALDPNDAEFHYQRVCAYFAKRECAQAIAGFADVVRLNPPDINDYRVSLRRFIKMRFEDAMLAKEQEHAIAYCDAAIQLDPNDATAYSDRALVYVQQGKYDRAVAEYGVAIALDSGDAMRYLERGEAYFHQGKYDRAIEDFDVVIRIWPANDSAYYNRGLSYFGLQEYDRAIEDCYSTIALNRRHTKARSLLAKSLRYRGVNWRHRITKHHNGTYRRFQTVINNRIYVFDTHSCARLDYNDMMYIRYNGRYMGLILTDLLNNFVKSDTSTPSLLPKQLFEENELGIYDWTEHRPEKIGGYYLSRAELTNPAGGCWN